MHTVTILEYNNYKILIIQNICNLFLSLSLSLSLSFIEYWTYCLHYNLNKYNVLMHGLLILKLIHLLCMQYSMQNEYQLLLTKLDYISIICSSPKYNATKIWFVLSIRFFKRKAKWDEWSDDQRQILFFLHAHMDMHACIHSVLDTKERLFQEVTIQPRLCISRVLCSAVISNVTGIRSRGSRDWRYERVRERERDPIAVFAILRSLQLRPR